MKARNTLRWGSLFRNGMMMATLSFAAQSVGVNSPPSCITGKLSSISSQLLISWITFNGPTRLSGIIGHRITDESLYVTVALASESLSCNFLIVATYPSQLKLSWSHCNWYKEPRLTRLIRMATPTALTRDIYSYSK